MKRFRKVCLLTFGFALTTVLGISIWQADAQNTPLTYPEINTALKTKLPNKSFKTKAELINWLIAQIKQRKIDRPLTKDREDDLRQAGATGELIETIRQNSPVLPDAVQTPAVRPTPAATQTSIAESTTPLGGREMKNSIGTEFVKIPRGSFMMGSTDAEIDKALTDTQNFDRTAKRERFSDEFPKHRVTIEYEFYIGKYEVTIGEWKKVMGDLPFGMKQGYESRFRENDAQPIVFVSWSEAKEFIRKLNELKDGYEYRLPSEAEWEYAARAGTKTEFFFGDSLSSDSANFNGEYPYGAASSGESLNKTVKVGSYAPNAWGLYDVHGNVAEWVEDIISDDYSSSAFPVNGSPNTQIGDSTYRVVRGGSWFAIGANCRSAERRKEKTGSSSEATGFRLVARPR